MNDLPQNETREKIMDAAEALFMARGYKAVRLRNIADKVGLRHASLYYYVPQGKEQLFIAVVQRSMERHKREMSRLIAAAGEDVRAQAYSVSDWLVSQPPIDLVRMVEADLPEIDPGKAGQLTRQVLDSLTEPLVLALQQAQDAGTVKLESGSMAAMALITLVQGVHHIPDASIPEGRQAFGRKLADMLLDGWLAR